MRPYMLSEMTWKLVKEMQIDLAVLPWGATEAHNYHLPYGTDNFQIEHIAAEAGKHAWEEGARLVILPTMAYGVNTGQADIRLDLNINPSTQLAILSDLIQVLDRQQIKKLVLLNGHGGNNFKPLLRELGLKYPEMFLVSTNFFDVVDRRMFFEHPGDHADELETSLMLHIKPNLVRPLDEAGKGSERKSRISAIREGWAWAERPWSTVSADTGIGDPSKATAEKGAQYLEALVLKLSRLFQEIGAIDINNRYE